MQFLTQMLPTRRTSTYRTGRSEPLPDNDVVLDIFEYRDGDLIRKKCYFKSKLGKPSGSIDSRGYLVSCIGGKTYLNHRLIYQMIHGSCPEMLDHIDGNRLNNKIDNLRPADKSQNNCNAKIRSDNTTGIKGVSWHVRDGCWTARLSYSGVSYSLGYHRTIEAAKAAVVAKRNELHAEFANHGGAVC